MHVYCLKYNIKIVTFCPNTFAGNQTVSTSFAKAQEEAEIVKGMNHDYIPTTSTSKVDLLKDDEIDVDEKIHEENPYGDLYTDEATIPDIALNNLASMIEEKSKNEDDGFKKEYAVRNRNLNYRFN